MRFDLPTPEPETQPFWDAARDGTVLIKHCRACGRHHFYPRPFCPFCWSGEVDWTPARGRASLYTWSVVHHNDLPPFRDRVPYVAAVVELEEGPRMMTTVVDCDPADLRIGMPLEAVPFPVSDEITAVAFRPAAAGR
jgi:uncharacterized OB-fold protein